LPSGTISYPLSERALDVQELDGGREGFPPPATTTDACDGGATILDPFQKEKRDPVQTPDNDQHLVVLVGHLLVIRRGRSRGRDNSRNPGADPELQALRPVRNVPADPSHLRDPGVHRGSYSTAVLLRSDIAAVFNLHLHPLHQNGNHRQRQVCGTASR